MTRLEVQLGASFMKLERDGLNNLRFSGVVRGGDLTALRLSPADRLVLHDCEASEATPADWLLGLELIFRRLCEQAKEETP
jgi:hypothetical protein